MSDLRQFGRVMTYILNIDPTYVYERDDFEIYNNLEKFSIEGWSLNIPEPTDSDLLNITQEQVALTEEKIKEEAEANDPIKILKKLNDNLILLDSKLAVVDSKLTVVDSKLTVVDTKVLALDTKVTAVEARQK